MSQKSNGIWCHTRIIEDLICFDHFPTKTWATIGSVEIGRETRTYAWRYASMIGQNYACLEPQDKILACMEGLSRKELWGVTLGLAAQVLLCVCTLSQVIDLKHRCLSYDLVSGLVISTPHSLIVHWSAQGKLSGRAVVAPTANAVSVPCCMRSQATTHHWKASRVDNQCDWWRF